MTFDRPSCKPVYHRKAVKSSGYPGRVAPLKQSGPAPLPRRGKSNQKRGEKAMNKHFFELPKAVKLAVWSALLAEWQKKKAANRTTG